MALTPQQLPLILKMIDHLRTGKRYRADELNSLIGRSKRTVLRYIEAFNAEMQDVEGVSIVRNEDSTYSLEGTSSGPWGLGEDQAVVLLLALQSVSRNVANAYGGEALTAASETLYHSFSDSLQTRYDETVAVLQTRQVEQAKADRSAAFFDLLLQAAISRKRVLIFYRSLAEEKPIDTELAPYRLLYTKRTWFCIGHSKRHDEVRTFNLARIGTLECLKTSFRVPKSFSLERYFGNAWRLIREGTVHHVRLRFSKQVAQNVAETEWHPTQRLTWLEDDALQVDFDVDGLHEIKWWILGYGANVEVIEPQALRDLIRQHAEGILDHYRDDSS